jgi:hypothetical protein
VYLSAGAYGREAGFVSLESNLDSGPEAIARDINEFGIAVGQVEGELGEGGLRRAEGEAALWDLSQCSGADRANYICWLTHYYNKHVLGCLDPPACPGADPWDGSHF